MNYNDLKTEINTGPLAAECVVKTDNEIADLINYRRYTAVQSRFVTARTVLAELGAGPGSAILDKLEQAAAMSSPVKWMIKFLALEGGVDIGNTETQAAIDELILASVLTASEGQALKAMALQPVSRAEMLGWAPITYDDVNRALAVEVAI